MFLSDRYLVGAAWSAWQLSVFAHGHGAEICPLSAITSPFPSPQKVSGREGYPSETAVKRGVRVVHGEKDFCEKLGKEDLCPCGSGHSFQALLPQWWQIRW